MARLLAVAGLLVTIGAVAYTRWSTSATPTFQEVRPSLYRLNYDWNMMPPFPPVPVAIWLIESSTLLSPKSWVLVDAGTDDSTSQEAILLGVKSKLSSAGGSLKVIMRKLVTLLPVSKPVRYSVTNHENAEVNTAPVLCSDSRPQGPHWSTDKAVASLSGCQGCIPRR